MQQSLPQEASLPIIAQQPVGKRKWMALSNARSNPAKPSEATQPPTTVGFLLLLLAALPFTSDASAKQHLERGSWMCFRDAKVTATPFLQFFAEERMRACAESREGEKKNDLAPISDDEEEEEIENGRRRRRAPRPVTPSSHTQSDGDDGASSSAGAVSHGASRNEDDCDEVISLPDVSSSVARREEALHSCSLSSIDDSIMTLIAGYLPLKDLTAIRSVSRKMQVAAWANAPTPLPGAVFLRFFRHHAARQSAARFTSSPPRHFLRWTCCGCGATQAVTNDSCAMCGTSKDLGFGVRRVFMGQLRKERTVELVDWLVATLFPDMHLVHVENHTNSKDGRGKGCAWVYISNAEDEARLLSLNKRIFMDIDDYGNEGLWYCGPEYTTYLANMAVAQAYIPHRPLPLPRQPLVCERPTPRASSIPPLQEETRPSLLANGGSGAFALQQHSNSNEHQQYHLAATNPSQVLHQAGARGYHGHGSLHPRDDDPSFMNQPGYYFNSHYGPQYFTGSNSYRDHYLSSADFVPQCPAQDFPDHRGWSHNPYAYDWAGDCMAMYAQ